MSPLAVIGDIHGDVGRLQKALEALSSSSRTLVFLGDYINRGSDSKGVVELLLRLKRTRPEPTIFLRGNHEAALLHWLKRGSSAVFVRHGGLSTVASYTSDRGPGVLERFAAEFPPQHLSFLEETQLYYEEQGLFVSHAGFDPSEPEDRSEQAMLSGAHPLKLAEVPSDKRPQPVVALGHFVQECAVPFDKNDILGLDTGCGTLPNGRLSAALFPERQYYQF